MSQDSIRLGLTYDDVLLQPAYSEVLPHQTQLQSQFSKNIQLNIPVASSAMDTVTESQTAIKMAQLGGIGVIHKNLEAKLQAKEVLKVKKYESGIIVEPICVTPEQRYFEVRELIRKFGFSGFPVVQGQMVVGIITNRDMRYESSKETLVKDMMTPVDRLVTAPKDVSLKEAKKILHENRIEKLPLVDEKGHLAGLVTVKDIEKSLTYPNACKDQKGSLRCAAAVGVGDKEIERSRLLVKAGVDAIIVDTAHGHSLGVINMVKTLKEEFKAEVDIVAGNVATASACEALIKAGVDAIKVGVGPGSICTTRIIAGIGVPQFQALMDCKDVCLKAKVPFIADGGIKYSGDIVKALAVGASCVMIGSLFAGTDEAPGERVIYQGRAFKIYRGMGSMGAMVLGSKDRYGQAGIVDEAKLVPEGIEGQVPYRGPLAENLYQLVGGIKAGMGYLGAKDLNELREKAEFVRITASSLKESHPHDIMITKEAPNYRSS
jgi:IMP dehydrogenase